jgi:hypothetical protein
MIMKIKTLSLIPLLASAVSLHGQVIVENFNDYGDTRVNLMDLGSAGGGWAGPWTNNIRPDYVPGAGLTYDQPGYAYNSENLVGANHGLASYHLGTGSQSGQVARRAFAEPLTGTIWISFLAHVDGPADNNTAGGAPVIPDVIFWLNHGQTPANFVALRGQVDGSKPGGYRVAAVSRYAGSDTFAAGSDFAEGTTHLLLSRIIIGADGNNDSLDFWVNPNLSGGEVGLGAPLLSFSGADAYGSSLTNIGVSFTGPLSQIDAIRISNAPDGFAQVIPEPSTYAFFVGLSILGTALLLRRKRRN